MKLVATFFATFFLFFFFNVVEGWGGDCDRRKDHPQDWRQNHHWHHHHHHHQRDPTPNPGWDEKRWNNEGGKTPPVITTEKPLFAQPPPKPEYVPQFNGNEFSDESREILDENGMNDFISLNARMETGRKG